MICLYFLSWLLCVFLHIMIIKDIVHFQVLCSSLITLYIPDTEFHKSTSRLLVDQIMNFIALSFHNDSTFCLHLLLMKNNTFSG